MPLEEFAANLRSMVRYLQSVDVPEGRLILITPPPLCEAAWARECLQQGESRLPDTGLRPQGSVTPFSQQRSQKSSHHVSCQQKACRGQPFAEKLSECCGLIRLSLPLVQSRWVALPPSGSGLSFHMPVQACGPRSLPHTPRTGLQPDSIHLRPGP